MSEEPTIMKRILHKLAHVAPGGWTLRPSLHRLRGVHIGKDVWISQWVYIDEIHPEAVTIQDNATIGFRTSIFAHLYWGARRSDNSFAEVIIEEDVFIGPHCLILPGVRIGRGAVIRGGTVVSRNVPALTFWGPPPAAALGRVTVPLTAGNTYEQFVMGLKPIKRRRKGTGMSAERICPENGEETKA
jgi:serine acetyltransferase